MQLYSSRPHRLPTRAPRIPSRPPSPVLPRHSVQCICRPRSSTHLLESIAVSWFDETFPSRRLRPPLDQRLLSCFSVISRSNCQRIQTEHKMRKMVPALYKHTILRHGSAAFGPCSAAEECILNIATSWQRPCTSRGPLTTIVASTDRFRSCLARQHYEVVGAHRLTTIASWSRTTRRRVYCWPGWWLIRTRPRLAYHRDASLQP